ncbi:MAG: hypothetical protein M3O70_25850 [Actinomycetota bacterium]|nr:hypothetical protein [Actinomycetota bacterium]
MAAPSAAPDLSAAPLPEDDFTAAVDRIRGQAVKGLAALGAIGALLVGTSPLTNFGKLDIPAGWPSSWAWPEDWRIVVAMAAAIVALGAVALLMGLVGRVLTPIHVRLADIKGSVAAAIERQGGPLAATDYKKIAELAQHFDELSKQRWNLRKRLTDPSTPLTPEEKRRLVQVDQAWLLLRPIINRIVVEAHWREVQARWDQALGSTWLIVLVAGIGIVVFAWAANPADPEGKDKAASAAVSAPAEPVRGRVDLGDELGPKMKKTLGDQCPTSGFDAIVIAYDGKTAEIVADDLRCQLVRLSVAVGDDVRVYAPAPVLAPSSARSEGTPAGKGDPAQ